MIGPFSSVRRHLAGRDVPRVFLLPVLFGLGIVVMCAMSGVFRPAHDGMVAWRSGQSLRAATGQVVQVAIDRRSLDAIGVWPWPRSLHAKAVDALVAAGARDIFIDIDFGARSDPKEDRALRDALERAGGSVMLPHFAQWDVAEGTGRPDLASEGQRVMRRSAPLPMFAERSWPVSVVVRPDADGRVRRVALMHAFGGERLPSLPGVLSGGAGEGEVAIDFSIDPATVPTYSFIDIVNGRVPRGVLRDKVVVIGAHAVELRDNFAVPVHGTISGPMLQILAAETLLQDRALTPPDVPLRIAIWLGVIGLALVALGGRGLPLRLAVLTGGVPLLELSAWWLQHESGLVLDTVPFHAFFALLGLWCAARDHGLVRLLLLRSKAERTNMRTVLDHVVADSSDGILVLDENRRVLERNRRFVALLGEDDAALPPVMDEHVSDVLGASASGSRRGESRLPSGRILEHVVTPSTIALAEERREGVERRIACLTVKDVSEDRRQRDRLTYMARHCPLTGALTSKTFLADLGKTFDTSTEALAIGTFEIVGFRGLNAVLGRNDCDALLRQVCDRVRALDMVGAVARIGADRFAFRFDADEAGRVGLALRAVPEEPFALSAGPTHVRLRTAYAADAVSRAADATHLLHDAEHALDAVKRRAADWLAFQPAMRESRERLRVIDGSMREALAAGQFTLVHQAQVKAADGRVCGAEALVRWVHPEVGFIAPPEFIAVAEANGFIEPLGAWILRQACRDATEWRDDVSVSVNVSAMQLGKGTFPTHVRAALAETGLAVERLELEITESSVLELNGRVRGELDELRALGIRIAMDDFGTGYSSLAYLASLPLSKIKVDRSLVQGIATDTAKQAILRSTVALADGLGLTLLCEGVEDADEHRMVRLAGAQEIQGYHFAKPEPQAAFLDRLRGGQDDEAKVA